MEKWLPFIGPAFLVAVGFMDPGNWATLIEGGSRFGYELVWVVLVSTLLAMLLQNISARLGVITGKHFAEVCREEFPKGVCIFLWVICEISVITLDLTMVLGTAIGLNVVLQIPIFSSLLLMGIDSLLFMIVLPFLDKKRAEVIAVVVVGIVLLCFLLDTIYSSTLPLSIITGFSPKLRHETLYTTISIVGANVMPHNFYLHSALVKDQGQGNQSLSTLSHYNFLGNLFAFSAVLVVNVAVFVVAVAGFHNAGLVVLTLQDAQALIEQILNNSISPAVFGLALLCAGQLATMNGSTAGQMVSETLVEYRFQPWQHRVWIRGLALLPAATCVWKYGNEGTYQMLMFAQVFLALHLPFAIAPLIKVTSSERIMGSYKNSFYLEMIAWLSLAILTAVNVTLVFDLVFGESEDGPSFGGLEYLAGFQWLLENGGESLQSVVFGVISMGTSLSLGFLVWLIFTPLQMDTPAEPQLTTRTSWMEEYARQERENLALQTLVTRPTTLETFANSGPLRSAVELVEVENVVDDSMLLVAGPSEGSEVVHLVDSEEDIEESSAPLIKNDSELLHLEDAEVDKDPSTHLVPIQGTEQLVYVHQREDLSPHPKSSPKLPSVDSSPKASSPKSSTGGSISREPFTVEETHAAEEGVAIALKLAEAEADAEIELLGKDEDEMDVWGTTGHGDVQSEALAANVDESNTSLQFDGPESGRSDASLGIEGGSGSGSLSRLSGLGRAARRSFALILDDFWAGLFDLHGQPVPSRSQGLLSALSGRHGDHNTRGSSSYPEGGSNAQKLQSKLSKASWRKSIGMSEQGLDMEAYLLRAHTHASASTSSQLSQAMGESQDYGISPSYVSERRYSSMRSPSYHEEYDYQPVTIHGYRTPSFPGRTAASLNARSLHLDVPSFGSRVSPGQGQQADVESILLQEDQWASNVAGSRNVIDTKGGDRLLSQAERHLGPSETSSYDPRQWDTRALASSNTNLGRWSPLAYRATGELDMTSTVRSSEDLSQIRASFSHSPIGRGGLGDHGDRAPLVFDELSPSQSHRDGFSIQSPTPARETQSLWSRQPFEQLFGSTDAEALTSQLNRHQRTGSRLVQSSLSGSSVPESVDIELEVLDNLQKCVGKLLRLDGADWIFRVDNGADEDLIAGIATMQKKFTEAETNDPYKFHGTHEHHSGEGHIRSHGRRGSSDRAPSRSMRVGVLRCGNSCVWDGALVVSFGVWCVHRVLELSLMESRPELWGKYTYVLNRLQGILDPAFSKPRSVPHLCFCFNDPTLLDVAKRRSSSSRQGGLRDHGSGEIGSSSLHSYPHPWPWGRNTSCPKGKATSSSTFLDMIKEVETTVSSRKGRTGTTAGDVAFPKGKENLASVLKRYKRRLSSKPVGSAGAGSGGRRV